MNTNIYKLTFKLTGYECFYAFLCADPDNASEEYLQKEKQTYSEVIKEISSIYTIEKVVENATVYPKKGSSLPEPNWLRLDITRYLVAKQQIKAGRTYPVSVMLYSEKEFHTPGFYVTDLFNIVNGYPQDRCTDEKFMQKIIYKYIHFSI